MPGRSRRGPRREQLLSTSHTSSERCAWGSASDGGSCGDPFHISPPSWILP
ncbi:hypothetical protein I79_012037 [Cricetulus griseus]|uniref:Uncharacterized protein n=1 Tax=Cricetulus griseus TaxID=10029 RepID=G3HMR5_CRIGR|nr:hypothetical protein I79_012037 [Cricetulus griseus]